MQPCSITDYATDFENASKINLDAQIKALDLGVNISYDNWGSITMGTFEIANAYYPNDIDKLRALNVLLQKGYSSQIMVGHDSIGKINSVEGGGYGYTRILNFVKPMLKNMGYDESVLERISIENPARFLEY